MTLAEYKANPSAWSPTFIVNSAATLQQWQNNAAGNDYERVRVDASLTTTYGIDLDYAGTKQVVFGGDYTLTFNLNELEGRCFYRPAKSADPELWMSMPKIKANNAYTSGNVYCFQNCNYIDSPTITSVTAGNSSASGGTGGSVYCFQNCDNITSPAITSVTAGNSSASGGTGGSVYCFQNCDNITSPIINTANGGSANATAAADVGTGGAVYCFQNCDNITSPIINNAIGGPISSATNNSTAFGGNLYCFHRSRNINDAIIGNIDAPSTQSYASNKGGDIKSNSGDGHVQGGAAHGFLDCSNISNAAIGAENRTQTRLVGGGVNSGGGTTIGFRAGGIVYCFQNCDNLTSPTINYASGGGTNGDIGTADPNTELGTYGYYNCRNLDHPKGVLVNSATPAYLHYNWSGIIENRAGSNATTALFYPAYGPYALVLSGPPHRGQPVTLQWRFISPDGTTVTGKTARLQVTLDGGDTWTDIYTGTNETYTYSVPADADSVRFRVFEGTEATPTSGAAYSALAEFTDTAVISGSDGDLGTFSTAFTPYSFPYRRRRTTRTSGHRRTSRYTSTTPSSTPTPSHLPRRKLSPSPARLGRRYATAHTRSKSRRNAS
jgi:hypothetical protein